ncbi:hypothetical protein, partial [Caballeronia arationis]|uniref:hypothetical protein n=1 Tax=Caballeronia arationis TaxID=1777142 RepID=UPI001F458824
MKLIGLSVSRGFLFMFATAPQVFCGAEQDCVPVVQVRISHQAGQGFRGKLDRLFTRSWTR